MYLYIRHAEKLFDNGKKAGSLTGPVTGKGCREYNHDPNITEEGRQKAIELGGDLVNRYGRPDRILVSPYRRCRETAAMLIESVNHPQNPEDEIPIIVVPDFGEYLGNQYKKRIEIELDPITKSFNPPIDHHYGHLTKRVTRQYRLLHQVGYGGVTWIVTHGIVIHAMKGLLSLTSQAEKGHEEYLSVTEIPGFAEIDADA